MNHTPAQDPQGSVTVRIPLTIRKRGGRKLILAADGEQSPWQPRPQINNALVKAIARAHRWQTLLEEGTYATITDLAAAQKITPSYVSRLLRLTLFAPPIVEAVLDGRFSGSASADPSAEISSVLWSLQTDA